MEIVLSQAADFSLKVTAIIERRAMTPKDAFAEVLKDYPGGIKKILNGLIVIFPDGSKAVRSQRGIQIVPVIKV